MHTSIPQAVPPNLKVSQQTDEGNFCMQNTEGDKRNSFETMIESQGGVKRMNY
jgi:hypothetical protein